MSSVTVTYDKNKVIIVVLVLIIISGVVGLVLFLRTKPSQQPQAPVVTTTRSSDTTNSHFSKDLPVQNNPQPSVTIVPVSVPQPIMQPATDVSGLTAQVKELIEQNRLLMQEKLTQREYPDTTALLDSSGFKVGEFRLKEIVTGNELASRLKSYTVNSRTITNTITTTIKEPYLPRNQVYLGAGITGDQSSILRALKAGFLLKNKKDAVFELNATRSLNAWGGEIGFYKLISFRKNK